MSTTHVDISGINKSELLRRLWFNSKPASFFMMSSLPAPTNPSDHELESPGC